MSILQHLMGNATEANVEKIQAEFQPFLVDGEVVVRAFSLFRDISILTNVRIITVDKQGTTGKKRIIQTIPYKSVRRFALVTASGMFSFDKDSEIWLWIHGEGNPIKWEFSTGVDIQSIYVALTHYCLIE